VLLKHPWGTHWQPDGELEWNILRTKEKWKNSSPPLPPPPKLKRTKLKAL